MEPQATRAGNAPSGPASDAAPEVRWIAVARLLRPQGRRGELLAEPLTDLADVFSKNRQFRLTAQPESAPTAPLTTLEDCWRPQGRNAGRLVLKLAGTNSITAAEALEGKELFLPEDQLPALEEDTYLVRDLVGCTLYDGDTSLGTITGLEFPVGPDGRTRLPDAPDLLVIAPAAAPDDADPVLVPFVRAWLQTVDLDGKRLVMHLPPGLFEEGA